MTDPAGGADRAAVLVIEHESGTGLDLMASALPTVQVLRPFLGDPLPDSADGYGGLLVLGGDMASWEDDRAPWLPATRALLATAVRAGVPTLGICLGAQLLSSACGGRVGRGEAGAEIGLVEVRAIPAAAGDPFVSRVLGGRAVLDVVQYHRDSISELPPDAEVLLTGSGYPIQAFRVGVAAWGVQYHPEVSAEAFARWAGGDPQGPRPEVVADVLAGADRQGRLARVHSEAFTALIRSPADSSPGPASGPRR